MDFLFSVTPQIDRSYRLNRTLGQRRRESQRLRSDHPDRVPVIIECSSDVPLQKKKYLVPHTASVAFFLMTVRKNIELGSQHGLYLHTEKGESPWMAQPMSSLYRYSHNDDGFLYLTLMREATFG